jgi:Putative prokaryotic signal transducing protein
VTRGEGSGTELVEVAFLGSEAEGVMVQALLEEQDIPSLLQQVTPSGAALGYGPLNPGGGARRVMVHEHRAEEARALLEESRVQAANEAPEPVNAEYLATARGRGPRNYSLLGAYARAFFWSFGALAVACGVFLLFRAL